MVCQAKVNFLMAILEHVIRYLYSIVQMVTGDKFSVLRTVTVDFAHVKIKKTWQKGFKPSEITIIAGSLSVENLGYITPESDYLNLLVPINYR